MIKKLTIIIIASVFLTACGTQTIIKKEIVTVDKPIPFVPTPPEVPKFVSKVDQLGPADVTDPGKVGQAYKYDTVFLRQLNQIHEMIESQYKASSQNFDAVNQQIDALMKNLNATQANADQPSVAQ